MWYWIGIIPRRTVGEERSSSRRERMNNAGTGWGGGEVFPRKVWGRIPGWISSGKSGDCEPSFQNVFRKSERTGAFTHPNYSLNLLKVTWVLSLSKNAQPRWNREILLAWRLPSDKDLVLANGSTHVRSARYGKGYKVTLILSQILNYLLLHNKDYFRRKTASDSDL